MKTMQKVALFVTIVPLLVTILYLNLDRFKSISWLDFSIAIGSVVVLLVWLAVLFYGITGVFPLKLPAIRRARRDR